MNTQILIHYGIINLEKIIDFLVTYANRTPNEMRSSMCNKQTKRDIPWTNKLLFNHLHQQDWVIII